MNTIMYYFIIKTIYDTHTQWIQKNHQNWKNTSQMNYSEIWEI